LKKLACCIAVVALAYAPRALACVNDTDCGATCGGMVCSFDVATYETCVAASSGDPGWCTGNAACQCAGATCNTTTHHCSFTQPMSGTDAATTMNDMTVTAKPDLSTQPDLSTKPVTTTSSSSSSGCDVSGGAPMSGLYWILGLALASALARRRVAG
jgi:hypothetical protein